MQSPDKLTWFWFVLVLAGIVLSLFFGIGWLFRAVMFAPPVRRRVRAWMGMPPERPVEDSQGAHFALILGFATLLAWLGLTIFAFVMMNEPLIEMFGR